MTDRAQPGDRPQQVCGFKFDATVCVAAPGHPGPHITSNASYPHGLAREPGDPLDLDQIQKALDRYWALWPQLVAPDEKNVGAVMTELALILPRDRTAKWLGSVLAALRDARQREANLEAARDGARQVVDELHAALAAAAEREKRYESAIRWALGEVGEFKPRAISPRTGKFVAGPYHWRDELRRRAGLEWLHK